MTETEPLPKVAPEGKTAVVWLHKQAPYNEGDLCAFDDEYVEKLMNAKPPRVRLYDQKADREHRAAHVNKLKQQAKAAIARAKKAEDEEKAQRQGEAALKKLADKKAKADSEAAKEAATSGDKVAEGDGGRRKPPTS